MCHAERFEALEADGVLILRGGWQDVMRGCDKTSMRLKAQPCLSCLASETHKVQRPWVGADIGPTLNPIISSIGLAKTFKTSSLLASCRSMKCRMRYKDSREPCMNVVLQSRWTRRIAKHVLCRLPAYSAVDPPTNPPGAVMVKHSPSHARITILAQRYWT